MMYQSGTFTLHIHLLDGSTQTVTLGDQPLVVGSGPEADVRLSARFLSRRHFQIERIAGRVYITDLDSQNGTRINGQRVEPLRRQAFAPGDTLTIANTVRIQLDSPPPPPPQPAPEGYLTLELNPVNLRAFRPATLNLTYMGGRDDQHVYMRGHSPGEGLEFDIQPREGWVKPGVPVWIQATVRPTQPFWFGGRFPVSFMAMTAEGLFARADGHVRVRRRWELLLLLLLLLALPVAVIIAAVTVAPALVAQIPTPTLAPTLPPTSTPVPPTALPTLPPTTTPTVTFTPLPTAVACVNRCAAFGWPFYTVQQGDTLASLALAADVSVAQVASVNCIANPNIIQVGQSICLPVIPTVPTNTPPAPTCAGFRPTSPYAFPNGAIDFYWDHPSQFTPSGYRVEVYNAENNALLVSRDAPASVYSVNIDVSKNAIGGNFTFFWRVHALVNGVSVCSGRLNVPREAPPNPPTNPPVNRPPRAVITSPACEPTSDACQDIAIDNTNDLFYTEYTLTGTGTDPEEGTLSGGRLVWRTNQTDLQSAVLGTGNSITVRLYIGDTASCDPFDLAETPHTITLTVTDSGGLTASATITVVAWRSPFCDG